MFDSRNHMSIFSNIITLPLSIYRDCIFLISPSTIYVTGFWKVSHSQPSLPAFTLRTLCNTRWGVDYRIVYIVG